MEKPGWGVRVHMQPQPRTRHTSLSIDLPTVQQQTPSPQRTLPLPPPPRPFRGQLQKADSSPLPQRAVSRPLERARAIDDGYSAAGARRASTPTEAVFPFCSAYTATAAGTSPFPCGSEGVLINSTLAHKAFLEQSDDEVEE